MGHHRNDGHKLKLQILIQPDIGLDKDVRQPVVEILNNTWMLRSYIENEPIYEESQKG